ncbi:MAG: hypothetical protein U0936_28110 [Planctomycetaceae bacterium]
MSLVGLLDPEHLAEPSGLRCRRYFHWRLTADAGHVRAGAAKVGDTGDKVVVPMSAVIRDGAERFVLVEERRYQVASTYKRANGGFEGSRASGPDRSAWQFVPGDRVVTRGSHELGSFFTKAC